MKVLGANGRVMHRKPRARRGRTQKKLLTCLAARHARIRGFACQGVSSKTRRRSWCVAVCSSACQCVAVCSSVEHCVAVYCSVLQCVAVYCSVLWCGAAWCSVLRCVMLCDACVVVAVCYMCHMLVKRFPPRLDYGLGVQWCVEVC